MYRLGILLKNLNLYTMRMSEFDQGDVGSDYERHIVERQRHLDELKNIIIDSKAQLEGNYFYKHRTLELQVEKHNKRLNIYYCGKQATTRICEIGFNAGHSCMLMLLGRDTTPLEFTVFDIGHHKYTRPCFEYIKSQFQHVNFEYIEGDSTVTVPRWIEKNEQKLGLYDVVHVDGGHSEHCITNDMRNTDNLVRVGGIVIVDDTHFGYINKCVDMYLASGKYRELNVLETKGYPHRIIQKIY